MVWVVWATKYHTKCHTRSLSTKLPPASSTWGLFSGEVELRDAEFEVDPLRKLLLGTLPFTWEVRPRPHQQQLQMLGFYRRWNRIIFRIKLYLLGCWPLLTHILSFERFFSKIWVHSVFIPFSFRFVPGRLPHLSVVGHDLRRHRSWRFPAIGCRSRYLGAPCGAVRCSWSWGSCECRRAGWQDGIGWMIGWI